MSHRRASPFGLVRSDDAGTSFGGYVAPCLASAGRVPTMDSSAPRGVVPVMGG